MDRSCVRIRSSKYISVYKDCVSAFHMRSANYWQYILAMAKLVFWTIVVMLVALFVRYYLDTPVPEDIPEKLKVQLIDASMRTYRHLIGALVKLGLTDYFSTLDRMISDWFILAQMTGHPWGLKLTADQTLRINDTKIEGVRTIIYEPVSTYKYDNRTILIFFHGGGWSTMSVDSYDPLIRKIARESGVVIISVNYRYSPEYPYPAPLNDCIKVVEYVTDNLSKFRIDPFKVAVGGDSIGANIAASVSLQLYDRIAMQFLIDPFLQFFDFKTTSFTENSRYFHDSLHSPSSLVYVTNYLGISSNHHQAFLNNNHVTKSLRSQYAEMVNQTIWMKPELVRNKYLLKKVDSSGDVINENNTLSNEIEELITDPFVAPLMANDTLLSYAPEAYIVTNGYNFIRDDGVMYAGRLSKAGTKVVHRHYSAGFHHAWFFPHGPLKLNVSVQIVSDLIYALINRL
ncbi:hypothetical protein ACF0H5_002725 [Mactra antiquata]